MDLHKDKDTPSRPSAQQTVPSTISQAPKCLYQLLVAKLLTLHDQGAMLAATANQVTKGRLKKIYKVFSTAPHGRLASALLHCRVILRGAGQVLSSLSSEYIWSERAKRTVPRHPRSTPLGFSPNHQATPKTLSIVSPSSLWTDTLSKQTVQFVGLYIRSLKQVSDVSHERKTVSRVENAMDLFGHDSRKHPMLRHKKSRWVSRHSSVSASGKHVGKAPTCFTNM